VFFSYKNGNADLFLTDHKGATPLQITDLPSDEVDPAWSPDGRRIIYASNRTGNYDLYIINADGTNEIRLTSDPSDERAPAWSPDGQYIAYQSNAETITSDIFVMRVDGSNVVRLTTHPAYDLAPVWSADGRKIAFHTQRQGGDNDIAIMDFNGANQIVLTDNTAYDADPSFTRDGSILFESDRDAGSYKIFRLNPATGVVESITPGSEDYYPSFGLTENGQGAFIYESRRDGSATFELVVWTEGQDTVITQNMDASSAAWKPDSAFNSRLQPLPVIEVLPTETPTPTLTPTLTVTTPPTLDPSIPTETPAPDVFMSIGTRAILIYDRPSQSATAVSVSGQRVAVTGVTADSTWYRIIINNREGWVQVNSSGWTLTGNPATLPLAAPAIIGTTDSDPGFLSVMFQSGFDTLPPTITNTGWETRLLDGESSLCSSDTGASMTFGDPNWTNYSVSLEFQFRGSETGKFYLITRMDDTGTGIRYEISADEDTVSTYTLRLPSGRSLAMSQVNINIRAKQWGLLRGENDGTKIRTFFEGLQTVEYELLSADYDKGYIGLETTPGTVICLNNLVVRSLYRSQQALSAAMPRATVNSNANMRLFPGQGFTAVNAATSGERVYVLATNDDNTWTYIRRDLTRNPAEGWIASSLITR
jgi:TolB protein